MCARLVRLRLGLRAEYIVSGAEYLCEKKGKNDRQVGEVRSADVGDAYQG